MVVLAIADAIIKGPHWLHSKRISHAVAVTHPLCYGLCSEAGS